MHRQSGFTLIELAVATAIIAIVSVIAIPGMISWVSNSRVNASARDIVACIQRARIEAVKQNRFVVVTFDADDNDVYDGSFIAYVDDGQGAGVAANWNQDGTERTVYSGQLRPGVNLSAISLGTQVDETRFNARAMPSHTGPIRLTNSRGHTVTITLGSGGIPTI
ncbi:MAG TPA: GspH/FimT family pseudopilin [Desulfosarcina sp.]|nr:GspH/FimT family pseudopilin [Desulfosarcina sp.]